jgi:hypothetical protein
MTFYELYQQYLNKYTAPQQGIMSIQPVTPVGESGGDGSPSPGMTAGPTSATGFSDAFGNISALDVALGLMNPVGLAVSLGARAVGLPSLQDIGKMAMNAVGFGDSSSTGTANATDTGDMGSEAANNAATAAANAAAAAAGGDSSGGGADGGGPGGGDSGDTGGPFRDGGRATLYDGGSAFDNYNAPEYIPSEDKNLSDYFNANVNYSTGESNPMNDVNVGTTNLQAIMNANIPIDDQFSLLGRLGYFKDRASVTYKDYPKEIYEGSSKDRALGLGYYNNGLSASGMYNVDTKSPELRLDYTTKFANGGRIGYAEGSNLYGGYSGNKISQVEDPLGLIQRLNKAGGNRTPYDNISYLPSEGGYVEWDGSSWTVTSPERIERQIKDWESVNYSPIQPPNTLNAQTTPTEDLSNNLNTTTINTNAQTTPTVAEQMMSPEDALTPPAPDVNPLQQHFDQNQMLKDAVASGEITPEQYNELGGYDVQQTLSPGNPLLGGIGNLIGSIGYNAVQSYKDKQSFGDAVGDVYRNVKGGLGLISPELKQTYQNIIQQRAPSNIAEHINTAISSFNPFQQQQYMNYAVQNPEQAIAAAQQNKDFLAATQKNTNPATPAPASMADGGRVFYLQGGLASLLG